MKVALCDDNQVFLVGMQKTLRKISLVEHLSVFADLDAFLSTIEGGAKYDVVLMDIMWNEDSIGIRVAEQLYALCPDTQIIYLTGYHDRFSQSIFLNRVNLCGFLVKPVDLQLLYANLQKVAEIVPFQKSSALVLSQQGTPIPILFREIYYIESWGRTIEVHAAEGTTRAYKSLSSVLHMLPAGFHQCHKSFVVNFRQVQRFSTNEILLKNSETIPVSRARYVDTKKAYFSFMSNTL